MAWTTIMQAMSPIALALFKQKLQKEHLKDDPRTPSFGSNKEMQELGAKSGAVATEDFSVGDRAGDYDAKYGTLGQVPPDVLMARWSQHSGKPMGSSERYGEGGGPGASYAQRGRDLRSMATQYKALTTQVKTMNPWGDYKNWSGGNKRGGFLKLGTKKKDKWKKRSASWMKSYGTSLGSEQKGFFSQDW